MKRQKTTPGFIGARFIFALRCGIAIMLCLAMAACSSGDAPLPGVRVTHAEAIVLVEKYHAQIDERMDDIELTIALSKEEFSPEEPIDVSFIITNKTQDDVVIRKPDAESLHISGVTGDGGYSLFFIVTPHDPANTLRFSSSHLLHTHLPEQSDEFKLLHAGEKYEAVVPMERPLHPMPPGKYSLAVQFTNYAFGIAVIGDSSKESYIIDYHAWIGKLTSTNIKTFEIIP